MNRLLLVLVLAASALTPCLAQDLPETLLRHDNFLVFDGHAGETITIELESIPKASYLYGDDLLVEVIDPASERPLRELVPVGSTVSLEYPVTMDGTHAVRLASGKNTVRAQISSAPWALVAWQNVPVNISGAMSPLFFKVPADVEQFSVSLVADVTGEAAEVTVLGPDGTVVANEVGDYDTPGTITVAVPEGADDAIWELRITDPADGDLNLDDVQFYLAGRVPPFLSPNRDDVEVFAVGEQYQPDLVDVTVPVSGRQSLGAGESATVTWRMNALPEDKLYALRITGNDVDYPRELTVCINGGEAIAVPVTGNATTDTFTLHIPREILRVGENTMVLTQDPSGGSNTVAAEESAILIGDRIREYKGY
ncbi:MAG TPA: hypothetical protein DEP45_02790 [Armatimonadetes bacterium]|nr:hypothetical protein [Armatimonadota bacterium]